MAKVTENYELMYIIDLDKGEEEIAAIVEKFKNLIEANGTLTEQDEWGKRKLAYLINDKPEGYYVYWPSSHLLRNSRRSLTVSSKSLTALCVH